MQKNLVYIESFENSHFEEQSIRLKQLFYKYNAKRLIIDGNGAGIGCVDYLVKPQYISGTDIKYPSFGIYNDEEGFYKKYQEDDTEKDAVYILKASAPINTEAHVNAQAQLVSGKLKLLIDERSAQKNLMGTKVGQAMTPERRAEELKPYTLTSILKEEMMNLREETEGLNIILKQANKSVKKDKFSALEYALYYVKVEEEAKKRKRKFKASE